MKIVLCGGGTGGHFYPLIAVAEAIESLTESHALIEPELYYIGPKPFDAMALAEHDISIYYAPAGKIRREDSIGNSISIFKSFFGILASIIRMFRLYPDVVFSTGGYAAYPTLWAARILSIPVVIYDADATPGRVSLWSAKFAKHIGVAHPTAADQFPQSQRVKIAHVGHPIRKEILHPVSEGGVEFLGLDASVQTIFIMGGSQGAVTINTNVIDILPELLSRYNVVHQVGIANVADVTDLSSVILKDSPFKNRYKIFGLLNTLAIRMAAGASSLVVARAGSGTIFEVASWGIPSILIPIPLDISHDQTENAFSYARYGATVVIEQYNLSPHLLLSEIDRLMNDSEHRARMSASALSFAQPNAARKIAKVLLDIAIGHES